MAIIIDEPISTFDKTTGCLNVDLMSRSGTKLRFHPWDEGLKVERWENGRWRPEPEDPGLCLMSEDGGPVSGAVRTFLMTIPHEIKELARPFRHCQTLVMRLLHRSIHARILARVSPILLLLVADAVDRGDFTEEQAVDLLSESRGKILQSLGGVRGQGSTRLLDRLRVAHFDQRTANLVRRAIEQPYTLHILRFHQEITTTGLRFAIKQNPIQSPRVSPSPRIAGRHGPFRDQEANVA